MSEKRSCEKIEALGNESILEGDGRRRPAHLGGAKKPPRQDEDAVLMRATEAPDAGESNGKR